MADKDCNFLTLAAWNSAASGIVQAYPYLIDTTVPTVSFSPVTTSTITNTQAVIVTVSDTVARGRHSIWITYGATNTGLLASIPLLAYDSTLGAVGNFAANVTTNTSTSHVVEITSTLNTNKWAANISQVYVLATDSTGNVTTGTATYTVTSPVPPIDITAPAIAITPTDGNTIVKTDAITVTVTDAVAVDTVTIWFVFADLPTQAVVAYDKALGAFSPISANVTTNTATQLTVELTYTDGWPDDIDAVYVIANDASGGTTTSSSHNYTVSNPNTPSSGGGGNPNTTYLGSGYLGS